MATGGFSRIDKFSVVYIFRYIFVLPFSRGSQFFEKF